MKDERSTAELHEDIGTFTRGCGSQWAEHIFRNWDTHAPIANLLPLATAIRLMYALLHVGGVEPPTSHPRTI